MSASWCLRVVCVFVSVQAGRSVILRSRGVWDPSVTRAVHCGAKCTGASTHPLGSRCNYELGASGMYPFSEVILSAIPVSEILFSELSSGR